MHNRGNFCLEHWLLSLLIVGAVSVAYSDESQEEICINSQPPVSKVINHLGHTLTSQIGGTNNLFFSPLSISIALAMVYLGARGTTAAQMESTLLYDLMEGNFTSEDVHRQFHSLLMLLGEESEDYKLLIANGMFPRVNCTVIPEFSSDLERYYSAQSEELDYAGDAEGAVDALNGWVSNKTEGKIEKLFESSLDPTTILVLLNAVYFKGNWSIPFSKQMTYERNFYSNDGTTKRVPFMEFKKRVFFYEDDELGYSFLELGYTGNHVSMLFALPDQREAFPDLQLTSELLCKVKSGLRKTKTEVFIPKFKMEYKRELNDDMNELGMDELFSQNSRGNLTGIREANDLSISIFLHEAVIEVNEQGSEAAAATGISFYARSGHMENHSTFLANHPFLFAIIDKRTNAILFTGRLTEP